MSDGFYQVNDYFEDQEEYWYGPDQDGEDLSLVGEEKAIAVI